ncbi:HHHH-motif protein [Burkholderia sp. NLJ2]
MLAPAIAAAHPHRVCHVNHRHHKVCRRVRQASRSRCGKAPAGRRFSMAG